MLARGLGHAAVLADHLHQRQVVALGDLEVDGAMGRRDAEGAGAGLRIHLFVRHHAHGDRRPLGPLDLVDLADVLAEALVVRVHGHRRIAELGLGAAGADQEGAVLDRVELGLALPVLDLVVRDGRLQVRVPIDDARRAVDQAVAEHAGEDAVDAAVQLRVHGVALPRPVAGRAHGAHLLADRVAAFGDEFGDPPHQLLAAELVARVRHPFGLELLDHHAFGGDGRVVGPGQPEHLVAGHPAPARHQVLDRQHHGVAGDEVLWLPGTDHAAIATESVVIKKLQAEGMPDPRHELGR
ncbi:MAG: hypothetical protein AAFX50_08580, partial [Acidobacteriota bacterium]